MKKTISIILCLALICMLTTGAFAADKKNDDISEPIDVNTYGSMYAEQITEDLTNLESIGFDDSCLSVDRLDEDGNVVYDINVNGMPTNQVKVNEDSSGNLNVEFFEGDVHNTLSFKSNGEIFLDGNKVIFDESVEKDIKTVEANARYSQYDKSPFKGKKADYTVFIKNKTKNSVSTGGTPIADLGSGAFITILLNALKASLGVSLYVGVVSSLAKSLKSTAERYGPNSAYFSYSVDKYQLKNNSTGLDKYYGYFGKYYIKKNCKGQVTKHNFYEYNYFA